MPGAELRFLCIQRSSIKLLSLIQLSLLLHEKSQIVHSCKRARVVRTQLSFTPSKRSAKKWFGLLQLALLLQETGHIVHPDEGVGMLGSQLGLSTFQGSAVKAFRLIQLAPLVQEDSEAIDRRKRGDAAHPAALRAPQGICASALPPAPASPALPGGQRSCSWS